VFDRHPKLTVHMAHLGGGIASMLGRIRGFRDKEFWGTQGDPRHGMKADKDFDYYLRNNIIFDTAGFCCEISAIKTALVEIPSARIVFATDYPQEVRERRVVRDFVQQLRALGTDGEKILSGNTGKLIKNR
jgi:predicted TIM-barrel fold metal-dependent hydrolase